MFLALARRIPSAHTAHAPHTPHTHSALRKQRARFVRPSRQHTRQTRTHRTAAGHTNNAASAARGRRHLSPINTEKTCCSAHAPATPSALATHAQLCFPGGLAMSRTGMRTRSISISTVDIAERGPLRPETRAPVRQGRRCKQGPLPATATKRSLAIQRDREPQHAPVAAHSLTRRAAVAPCLSLSLSFLLYQRIRVTEEAVWRALVIFLFLSFFSYVRLPLPIESPCCFEVCRPWLVEAPASCLFAMLPRDFWGEAPCTPGRPHV